MRPIEHYVEESDALAQKVVDAWADNLRVDNAHSLGDDFKVLFDKAFAYRQARLIVASHHELHILTPSEVVDAQTARQSFAEVYKAYWDKHEAASAD